MRNALSFIRRPARGFTLLEVAVAVLIVGVMTGGLLVLYNMGEKQRSTDRTDANMRQIVAALATFAESAGRLPCPADPAVANDLFGWEWDVAGAPVGGGRPVAPNPCQTWANPVGAAVPVNVGIVPFLTLGLPEETARDAWGNYFTYAVSPVFAQNNDDINTAVARANAPGGNPDQSDDQGRAHVSCLDGAWYDNEDNVNAVKAKFCCARDGMAAPVASASDISIAHTDGTVIHPRPAAAPSEYYEYPRDGTATNYVFVDPYREFGVDTPDDNDSPYIYVPNVTAAGNRQAGTLSSETGQGSVAAPAFVLLSHGANGEGAFLADNSRNIRNTGGAGAQELLNFDWDNVFVLGPADTSNDNTYFDDIIVWRTQQGIMAENGSSSCAYP